MTDSFCCDNELLIILKQYCTLHYITLQYNHTFLPPHYNTIILCLCPLQPSTGIIHDESPKWPACESINVQTRQIMRLSHRAQIKMHHSWHNVIPLFCYHETMKCDLLYWGCEVHGGNVHVYPQASLYKIRVQEKPWNRVNFIMVHQG